MKIKSVDTTRFNKKMQFALNECGKVLLKRSKELCPVETGKLRNSIEMKVEGNNVEVGTKGVDYAVFVEYGTGPMVKAHGAHNPEKPVRSWEALRKRGEVGQTMPFLRTALFEKKFQFAKIIKKVFS
jgi:HK97 gp10 family phage protein